MTRLSTGLAATCQLKREGPVEMKELFTRAPWEHDLKTPMTAVRGTGDAGCVLASYSATSSSPPSQHPPSIPLKEGSRKLGVFVASASSTASAGDAGSSLQQGTRRTAAAAPPPPLLQPSAPRVCSWALPARRGQRVTQARGCDR
ncbi:uncharacterized protein WM294_012795 isoform 2-T2 [Sarcoramphus papa]